MVLPVCGARYASHSATKRTPFLVRCRIGKYGQEVVDLTDQLASISSSPGRVEGQFQRHSLDIVHGSNVHDDIALVYVIIICKGFERPVDDSWTKGRTPVEEMDHSPVRNRTRCEDTG